MDLALDLRVANATQLNLDEAEQITELRLQAWPHLAGRSEGTADFLIQSWRDYDGPLQQRPLYHLVYQDSELVAVAHTLARKIASREREMTVMGLASVCVAKNLRGHGYGRTVVQAAFERIGTDSFEVALFQTTHPVEPFYTRLGAVTVHNRFYNSLAEDPTANPFWDPVTMRYPATGAWPTSDIDLLGPGY